MATLTKVVNGVLVTVIVAVFSVLVAGVVWQVFSRYILGTPSTVTDEMARFMFMWVGLLGAAYTLGQRRHLAIDFLSSSLSDRSKRAVDMLITACIGSFAALVMVYGGTQLVVRTLVSGQVSPALRLPMGYVYVAIPFSGLAILYFCIDFFRDILRNGRGPNDKVGDLADDPLEQG